MASALSGHAWRTAHRFQVRFTDALDAFLERARFLGDERILRVSPPSPPHSSLIGTPITSSSPSSSNISAGNRCSSSMSCAMGESPPRRTPERCRGSSGVRREARSPCLSFDVSAINQSNDREDFAPTRFLEGMAFRRLVRGPVAWPRLEAVVRDLRDRYDRQELHVRFLEADNWLSTPMVVDDEWFVKVISRQNSLVHALFTTGRNLGAFSSGTEGFFEHFGTPYEMAEHELAATRRCGRSALTLPNDFDFEYDGSTLVLRARLRRWMTFRRDRRATQSTVLDFLTGSLGRSRTAISAVRTCSWPTVPVLHRRHERPRGGDRRRSRLRRRLCPWRLRAAYRCTGAVSAAARMR